MVATWYKNWIIGTEIMKEMASGWLPIERESAGVQPRNGLMSSAKSSARRYCSPSRWSGAGELGQSSMQSSWFC